jgi:GNAT superfamily N-acetyltransferase
VTVNPSFHLRRARSEDAPAVADIWNAGWHDGHDGRVPEALVAARDPASFQTRAAQRVTDTTVAETSGEVTSFVMVVSDEVEQIYVAGHHRGSGVAGLLLDEAERQIRAAGHAQAWLAVVPGNTRARRFYERHGWHDAGPFDYAATGHDGPIPVPCRRYVKQLTPHD